MSKKKIKRLGGGKVSVSKEIKLISSLRNKVQKLEQENVEIKEELDGLRKKEFMYNITVALKQIKDGKGLTKKQVFGGAV